MILYPFLMSLLRWGENHHRRRVTEHPGGAAL